MNRIRGSGLVALSALCFAVLLAPAASAAVSITKAELSGSKLRVEGGGAKPNTLVTVNGGEPSATSDGSGMYRIESSSFTAPADCNVTVSDGTTSASATLSGCTPSELPGTLEAPTPLGPDEGASVLVPFTISWSAVTHSSGIAGYNWEVSTTSSFSVLTLRDSTAGDLTQDTVASLANGTYFWRVQAVSVDLLEQGPWSETRSFTVTGAAEGSLAAPTLSLVHGAAFHPFESFGFSWTAVEGASLYFLEWSRDSSFPADSTSKIDNIDGLTTGLTIGDFCDGCEQGAYFARVYAVDANRVAGRWSNSVSWTISYDAPIAAPPTPLAPADSATLPLPIELRWTDALNPQPMGYEIQVARDAAFSDVEAYVPQLTNPRFLLLSLTAGTKYWRVRHGQGMASPTTPAFTDWSSASSFTVPAGAALQSIWLGGPPCENPCTDTLNSGQEIEVSIQLTVAVETDSVVTLSSSDPSVSGSHPDSVTLPAGTAFVTFRLTAGSVVEPTQVTITGTLGSSTADLVLTVLPPALKRLSFCCDTTGSFPLPGFLELTGPAPEGGIVVNLTSDSPLASPPATVTVPEGSFSVPVPIPTSEVTTAATVTISATYAGQTVETSHTLWPQQPPTEFFLDRTSATGTEGAWATVRIAEGQPHEVQMRITSSHPEIASVQDARIGVWGVNGGVFVNTQPPEVSTDVTISAKGAGVTLTVVLTVHPAEGPTTTTSLSTLDLSPTNVTGGDSATGTVTLTEPAPAGGAEIALTSSNTSVVGVPASVTVPAGQTSVGFEVVTGGVSADTSVTISVSAGATTLSASLTVKAATASTDSVSISRAEYDSGKARLRVEASSSSSSATLSVYVSATNELIGRLSGGKGEFSWPTNPQNIAVRSSLGGAATATVTAK